MHMTLLYTPVVGIVCVYGTLMWAWDCGVYRETVCASGGSGCVQNVDGIIIGFEFTATVDEDEFPDSPPRLPPTIVVASPMEWAE